MGKEEGSPKISGERMGGKIDDRGFRLRNEGEGEE